MRKSTLKLIAVATNFIFEMLIALVIGFFLGRYLDGRFNFDGLLAGVFMVLLGAGAIWQFIRRLIKIGNES